MDKGEDRRDGVGTRGQGIRGRLDEEGRKGRTGWDREAVRAGPSLQAGTLEAEWHGSSSWPRGGLHFTWMVTKGWWRSGIAGLAAFFLPLTLQAATEPPSPGPPSLPSLPSSSMLPLTFVPDQVVAQEDQQDEKQEDDESHDPTNDGVVGAGGRRHRAGVCGEGTHTVRPGRVPCLTAPLAVAMPWILYTAQNMGQPQEKGVDPTAEEICLILFLSLLHSVWNVIIIKKSCIHE